MPLKGEYEPSKAQSVRDQVELYESSGGMEGTTLQDLPVVILTTVGAKSGKIRKVPVMRVEHDRSYAVVASMAGAPKHPVWYLNAVADPRVELQDGPVRQDMLAREVTGDEKACGGPEPSRRSRATPSTRRTRNVRSRSSFWSQLRRGTDVALTSHDHQPRSTS
jgi:deazaflavin-dependent oxidoreductase (nitroreductase family)